MACALDIVMERLEVVFSERRDNYVIVLGPRVIYLSFTTCCFPLGIYF